MKEKLYLNSVIFSEYNLVICYQSPILLNAGKLREKLCAVCSVISGDF